MIERWMITGDTHGDFSRFKNYNEDVKKNPNVAVIILGDAGFNFFLDERDNHTKNAIAKKYAFRIYCVRGNHEARPQDIADMQIIYDEDVDGEVYIQEKWPNIRYFMDWGIYEINGYSVGVIGGAYSVDKWYRLDRGAPWFSNEQLTAEERATALDFFADRDVDFMLTHSCPISWEPTDLFLPMIDQSRVDKTTEKFLEEIKDEVNAYIWLFGHYHNDRLERPYIEQFFRDTEDMENIFDRWKKWEKTGELDWWLTKSPNFYMGVQ